MLFLVRSDAIQMTLGEYIKGFFSILSKEGPSLVAESTAPISPADPKAQQLTHMSLAGEPESQLAQMHANPSDLCEPPPMGGGLYNLCQAVRALMLSHQRPPSFALEGTMMSQLKGGPV